jgi:folylpolyglutamate synthase/dihydropteroate synthase
LAAVRRAAAEVGAELVVAGEVASWRGLGGGDLEVKTDRRVHRLRPRVAGAHQAVNLSLAVLAAERLRRLGWSRIDAAAIAVGAESCRWPGRLESVELPGAPGRQVLLDVAHNPDAAARLAEHLEGLGRPYDLLFGTLEDKASERILPPLAATARRVVLSLPSGPRGRQPAELLPLVHGSTAIVEPRLERALDRVLDGGFDGALDEVAAGSSPLLVVCGSFYLVGEVRRLLRERFGTPPPAAQIAVC